MTIDRTLVRIERDGECTVVEQDRVDPLFDPVVILGDPGMGKTTLLRGLCRRTGMTYVHAADLLRAGDPASLIPGGERAAVDASQTSCALPLSVTRAASTSRTIGRFCRSSAWRQTARLCCLTIIATRLSGKCSITIWRSN